MNLKKNWTWTLSEDIKLHLLARKYFHSFAKLNKIDVNSKEAIQFHADFDSQERDVASLLFRLEKAKLFAFSNRPGSPIQSFKCRLKDDSALYDFSVCMPLLKNKLHIETISAILELFDSSKKETFNDELTINIANKMKLTQVEIEKVLMDAGKIKINEYREYVYSDINDCSSNYSVSSIINEQSPNKEIVDKINKCRMRASELYDVHQRDGAEIIFSSDGTGFGKSYGVFETYVNYLKQFQNKIGDDVLIHDENFTNFLFMSPQKSQIDLNEEHKKHIKQFGGEFICVLSRADTSDLDFVDWATGLTNRERYQTWCRDGISSKYIKAELNNIKYHTQQIDSINDQIKYNTFHGGEESTDQNITLELQLKISKYNLINAIFKACNKLFERENSDSSLVRKFVLLGREARQRRLKNDSNKKPIKMTVNEIYLEIIKQVLPFEVCQYVPSVLLMTTRKFDTTTKRLVYKKDNSGVRFDDVNFEYIIGGKLNKNKESTIKEKYNSIGDVCNKPHTKQVDYLREVHFKTNPNCPFRKNNIRFTVIVDELHEAYNQLAKSCHVKLVTKENNLAHILSVIRRIYQEVQNLEERKVLKLQQTEFEKEGVKLITSLRKVLDQNCEFSTHTTLDNFLFRFSNQLGAFEVNADSAERIIAITKNIFSFSAKMYVNEEALKQIRLRHVHGNLTRTELYYEVAGDTNDINPTLHDLFQLVSAILAACSEITNRAYKRWIKTAGQYQAPSQNMPLGQFVDAANKVSAEVRYIFERNTDKDLEINHFYTYLMPKTVFTMAPVEKLNFYNKGAERTVILAFEMDLIKEMPEAMVMRMLTGTNNKILGLSATSGFTHLKNGNFNRTFLNRYSNELKYQLVSRPSSDIPMLQKLRKHRANIRTVTFNVFDCEHLKFTNTSTENNDFRIVYNEIYHSLEKELETKSVNNIYKKRQINRELEALLLAAFNGKNTLVLSLSSEFKNAFTNAYRKNKINWVKKYAFKLCLDENDASHEQVFEFTPFLGRNKLRVVFFNSELARTIDVRKHTYITNSNLSLVFMSTYNSAGTGLNYFVKYQHQNSTENDSQTIEREGLDVDFQRLVLINSSFYSEVKNGPGSLNTLPNYITLLKHMADDQETHFVRDLSDNFTHGDNYRLLMAEHLMSLFKVIVQAIGRVERRDTLLNTEIYLPSDVIDNVAFQFSALKEDTVNDVVIDCMSLLNYKLKEHCEKITVDNSFKNEHDRHDFETKMLSDGKRIQQVHEKILVKNWINKVRAGKSEYLSICNLFRDPLSYTNPSAWLDKLNKNPVFNSNKQMIDIFNKMFISHQQGDKRVKICHKRGLDGLPSRQFWALSDYAGGAAEYKPQLRIFPQYVKEINFSGYDIVSKIVNHFIDVQKKAFVNLVPHPEMLPLLKGNVGEAMFDMVLTHYNILSMSDNAIFSRLSPTVFELFDRFITVDETLICIDVKNWTTILDNFERDVKTIDKGIRKIDQIMSIFHERQAQAIVSNAIGSQYKYIKFVYINTAYSLNPNNLMCEENESHSIYFFNLFQLEPTYKQPYDKKSNRFKDESKLERKLIINPQLLSLLNVGIE